jgi:methionyl-tRNA formyltransferase
MENKTIKIRTVFMGTSYLAEEILSNLIENKYNIVGVYTKPDKKAGREKEITKSPVKILAENSNLTIFQPVKFNEEAIVELKKLKPDLIIVAAYGKILPKEVLEIPGFGAINIHPSLLPKFRGPSPIQNALLLGEKETGTTLMLMDAGMDSGDIIFQEKIEIEDDDNALTLTKKLSTLSKEAILKIIPLWIDRKIEAKPQDKSKITLCQLIERDDGRIFWEENAEIIYNKYRALYPWPGIFTFWKNENHLQRIKLLKISIQKLNAQVVHPAGFVFEIGDKIGVQTLDGIIIIEELQVEGKKPIKISEFINGYPNFLGNILK